MNSELVYRIIKCFINHYAAPEELSGTSITPFFLQYFSKKRDIKYGAHTMFRAYSSATEHSYYLNLLSSPVKSETVENKPVPGAPNEMPVLAERLHTVALELLWIIRDIPCKTSKKISVLAQELELDLINAKLTSPSNYIAAANRIDRYLAANKSSDENLEEFNFNIALIQYSEFLKLMDDSIEAIEAGFPKVTHSDGGRLFNPYETDTAIACVLFWACKIFTDPSSGEPQYYIENTKWTFERMNDMMDNVLKISEASKSLEAFITETNIPIRIKTADTITPDQELAVESRLKDLQQILLPFAVKAISGEYSDSRTPGEVAKKALSRAEDSDTVLSYIFEAIDDCAKIISAEIMA